MLANIRYDAVDPHPARNAPPSPSGDLCKTAERRLMPLGVILSRRFGALSGARGALTRTKSTWLLASGPPTS